MTSPGSVIFSLQSKLIVAFALVVLAALALAGSVFVFVRRGEQEQQALDHVIAASPAIYTEFTFLQRRGDPERVLAEFVRVAAEEHDVRILLVDRTDGTMAADSEDDLTGERLSLPSEFSVARPGPLRPYISWHPEDGSPGSDLILVSALPSRLRQFRQMPPRGAEPYWPVLAVPKGTIAGAWRGLLPALGVAAAIALPAAAVLAILVARYITRPLQQLTVASQQMAEGRFDVRVSVGRRDEVGRLAQAFSTMARRVGEAHSQMRALVANVSHDLKTPLTSILGFAQALRDGGAADEAEVRRMGGVIYEEASRLTTRLDDLLYLSELESGQALVQRDEIDLQRLVEGAVRRIEPVVTARDVRLSVDLAGGVTLSADGPKLERALENLLDNARKYAPAGGEIRVRTYAEPGAPGYACIEVANTAPDITPQELPRLFERFYRRDRTRAERGGSAGSGLGLPIARDLIELHGGTLEASVSDGEIVFTIRLPGTEGQA
jgi:signal transduction histidine kinase